MDKGGRELYAGPNIDLRAIAEGISLDSECGEEIYSITGHSPSLLFVPAKLKWFQTNHPETFENIATVLTISDWIVFKLCGQRVSEVCGVAELGLLDICGRTWSDRLSALLALPHGIYPELVSVGSRVGSVTSGAAAETGLPQGTAVAMAAPDTQCGLTGLGLKENEQVGIVMGWTAPVQMVTDKPVLDPEGKTWSSCHLFPNRWVLESSVGEAGNAYSWLRETLFSQGECSAEESYHLMDHLAEQAPLGAEGVLAFIGPAAMDMTNLALRFGGFLFPVPLSVTNIQRSHLVRAALENLCFAFKANCSQLEAISGLQMGVVSLGGGMARSQCLTQALPSVLDLPVLVPETTEVSALGAAMCAAVGSGVYSTLEEAMSAMKPGVRVIEPDCLAVLEYADHYQRWSTAAGWLEKLSEEIQ